MNADEFARTMERLSARYLEEVSRGAERYAAYLSSLAGPGANDPVNADRAAELQKRYAEFVLAEAPRLLASAAEAGVHYYTAVAELGAQAVNRYFGQVLRADASVTAPRERNPAPLAPDRSALIFHGERGKAASNAFLVSNNRDQPIDVAFDVSEVTSEDGRIRFKPKAEFNPPHCTLAPRAEQVVRCSLELDEEFAVRQAHTGTIQVVGFPEMAMPIKVELEETDVPPEPERGAASKRKPSAKKEAGRTRR